MPPTKSPRTRHARSGTITARHILSIPNANHSIGPAAHFSVPPVTLRYGVTPVTPTSNIPVHCEVMPVLSETEELRSTLFSRLASKTTVDVNIANLERLVTFVENRPLSSTHNTITSPYTSLGQTSHPESPYRSPPNRQLSAAKENKPVSLPKLETPRPKSKSSSRTLSSLQSYYSNRSSATKRDIPPESTSISLLGGRPIRYDEAARLRQLVYGGSVFCFSTVWRQATFIFNDIRGPHGYGLVANRDATTALIVCVQAFMLKHLIYGVNCHEEYRNVYLCPDDYQRREALISGLADILWQAGQGRRAVVVLPSDTVHVEASKTYRPDGITEKLHLFEFRSCNEIRRFIRKNFNYFECPKYSGCILILYSLAFSRQLDDLYNDDFQCNRRLTLLEPNESLTPACILLLITGRASQFLHNGTIYQDELTGENLPVPQVGVFSRSDIGFLQWNREWLDPDKLAEMKDPWVTTRHVGSMLKTPRYPIWITRINRTYMGVLFSTSMDLICHWRAEQRFTMHYYNTQLHQPLCKLSLDTFRPRTCVKRSKQAAIEEEKKIPALEQCLLTKWYGASISWNSTIPFV